MSLPPAARRFTLLGSLLCALSLSLGLAAVAHSADDEPKDSAKSDAKADAKNDDKKGDNAGEKASDKDADKKKDETEPIVTHHTATIGGKEIKYTATAGKMLMATDEGDPKAYVFFVAYTVDDPNEHANNNEHGPVNRDAAAERGSADNDDDDDSKHENDNDENVSDKKAKDKKAKDKNDADDAAPEPNRRPITYCYNGGPGSSSVWLHLGMLGPVRVRLDSNARPLPPPHELIANPYSLLDVTDLVFIDPVSTGFSRPAKGENKDQFHGYAEDIASVGQFIHDYTTKNARWASPKFLIGESYGGLRTAGLAGELRERYHLELNGAIMISAVVDFQTLMTGGNNDIAYALFLPSYAATAWYHKALDDDLQEESLEDVVKQAEEFAGGAYLRALAAGDSLPEERRQRIVRRMAELTGLSEKYIEAANLRVSMGQFGKELLRDRKLVVGRFDSRYTGFDESTLGEYAQHDPSAEAVFGTFTSALNDYLRTKLKVDDPRVYEILTNNVHPWNFRQFTNEYVNASAPLRDAMVHNPFLKVYAACGFFDLATPQFAMQYTRDHLNLPSEVREHFTIGFYEAGHMMYAHEPSLVKLREELLKFYQDALPQESQ